MKLLRTFSLFSFLLSMILFYRCANPVTPTGGPKDVQPPEVLKCIPPNFSTSFSTDEIKIEFDEFVDIETSGNQIIVSPPWLPNTDFKLRGKSILIRINDSLHPNTTYAINFGNSISDITEKNPLENFNFVFSTGAFVDSLSIDGQVKDAFDLSPQKDVLVMLYVDNNDTIPFDSLPFEVKPYYLTRTNEKGEFRLGNLSDSPFKLFALKDVNNDFLYNLPDEKIAFSDTLISGAYIAPSLPDTGLRDTIAMNDTVALSKEEHNVLTLRLFQQHDSIQKILKYRLIQDGQIGIYFRYPTKNPAFVPLNFDSIPDWKLEETSRNHDTIIIWVKQVPVDSIILQISDDGKIIDTLEIDLGRKKDKEKTAKKEEEKIQRLGIMLNTMSGSFNQFTNDLALVFSYPLARYDLSSVTLVEEKDTLKPLLAIADSLTRTIKILHKWKEEKKYRVIIPDSSFYAINELTNDSLIMPFRTRPERDFGSLRLKIDFADGEGPYIIQLLGEKNELVAQRILEVPEELVFNYLNPSKYKLKAIYDKNKNHHWDTGDYIGKIQPEEVWFFPEIIELRANWEVEETWAI